MKQNSISIDLDVHKTLEAKRESFDESYNEILRRILQLDEPFAGIDNDEEDAKISRSRASGEYDLVVMEETVRVRSLKEALKEALLRLEKTQPGFLERLTSYRTRRGRRIVARTQAEIYPGKRQLERYAARLNAKWYFDTNISRGACEKYLRIIGEIANIEAPRIL